jgi:site-specific recombinase XerD
VLTARYAGLRREELYNLKVKDITDSYLIVCEGKGLKDRSIPLSGAINNWLHDFIRDNAPDSTVLGFTPESISIKILFFAKKAGLSGSIPHRFV